MDNTPTTATYEIRIQGHLSPHRTRQLENVAATRLPDGTTLLVGHALDQAALHGLLSRIRDLGLLLISVQRCAPGGPPT